MIWRLSGLLLLGLLALMSLALAGLLLTSQGSRVLAGLAERVLAPELAIEGINGALINEICLRRVTYLQPTVVVELHELCVQPNLWISFDFLKVSLTALKARRVEIRTVATEEAPPAEASDGAWLPVDVEVSRLAIGELVINDFAISDLDAFVDLSERNLRTRSSLVLQEQAMTLATSGGWEALRAELGFAGVAVDATVNLRAPDLPFSLAASAGRLDLAAWLNREALVSGLNLTADGDLNTIRLNGSAQIEDALLGQAGIRLSGSTDLSQASFQAQLANAEPELAEVAVGELTLAGNLAWSPAVRFDVTGTARGFEFEPRALTVDGEFLLRGDPERFQVEARSLVGASHGVPFSGQLTGRWEAGVVHVDDASIETGDGAALEIAGFASADGELDLVASAEEFPLAALDPIVAGALSGRITVRGPVERAVAEGQLQVASLMYADTVIDQFTMVFDGRSDAASVTITAERVDQTGAVAFDYALTGDAARLDVRSLSVELQESEVGPLSLALVDPVTVQVSDGRVAVDSVCLNIVPLAVGERTALLCGEFHYPDGPVRFSLQPFSLPSVPVLGDTLGFRGQLRGDLALSGLSPPVGQARLVLEELLAVDNERQTLDLGTLVAAVELTDYRALIDIQTPPEQSFQLGAKLTATLAEVPMASEIDGALRLDLDGIWLIESLLPIGLQFDVGDITGAVTVDVSVAGTVGSPAVDGAVRLTDGSWHVFALNTDFRNVGMQAKLDQSNRLVLDGSGEVGGGTVTVSGSFDGLSGVEPELGTQIVLASVRVLDLPDYSAVLDGRASLAMTREALKVSGTLTMPTALVQINELPDTAVAASPDAVLVGEDVIRQQLRSTDVSLTLGRDVRLKAFGLDTFLEGNLTLVERPGEEPRVTGAIRLREGTFEGYGQALEVQRGLLTFTGRMDDPIVDVVASRVVIHEGRDVLIALVIGGTALELSTRVQSSPQLSEEDALALLITGRTFSQASNQGQSNISGAALALGLFGATGLTGNMAQTLGLEEIIIDQDTDGNMKVGAAVRLNRDLYLRYTYGVFSRIGGVLLRYRLNERLSVQAQTGDAHSIEVRYGVDD